MLHSRDIRKQQGDFAVLRDAARRAKFMSGMPAVIAEAPFTLCVTAIDKIRHKERYRNPYKPYHLSLQYCLERAYRFPIAQEQRGERTHIIAELSIGFQFPATLAVAEPVVQGVHGRVPRTPRSALMADAAARVGGACGPPWATDGWKALDQERFLNCRLSLPVSRMSQ